jgi:electron transfer flavoprotein beta subunit
LIFTGLMADDTNFSALPPMLAELLGLLSATGVVKTEFSNGAIRVERELEGGAYEVVDLPTPAVVAVQTGANQVRYASLKGIMQAKKKPVDVKTAADLGVGNLGAKVKIDKIFSPPKGAGATILKGSKDEVVAGLLAKIKELGLL